MDGYPYDFNDNTLKSLPQEAIIKNGEFSEKTEVSKLQSKNHAIFLIIVFPLLQVKSSDW
ncbi:MAG: hypothetical protein ACO2ZM_08425, partial [Francisellaceae bacterium]